MNPSLKATCIVSEAFEEMVEENILSEDFNQLDEGIFGTIKNLWNKGKNVYRTAKRAHDIGMKIYRLGKSISDSQVIDVLRKDVFGKSQFDVETIKNLAQAVTKDADEYKNKKMEIDDLMSLLSRKDQSELKKGNVEDEDLQKLVTFMQSSTQAKFS